MQLNTFRQKWISVKLLLVILFQIIYPSVGFSLTSGPSQPEFSSFQPVGNTDLVDPFTGDFSYNIPLLDVDGYPVNIFYNSNVTSEQEASWTGLGWNINAGNINRNVRGLPDDFNADQIIKRMHLKDDWTFGISYRPYVEFLGLGGVGQNVGAFFNSYKGLGFEVGFNAHFSLAESMGLPINASLSYNVNSQEGASITPGVGLSFTQKYNDSKMLGGSISGSMTYNSRQGLKQFSISASVTASTYYSSSVKTDKVDADNNPVSVVVDKVDKSASMGVGASFDLGGPTYAPQVTMPINYYSFSGHLALGVEIQGGTFYPFSWKAYYSEQNLEKEESKNPSYGYLYHDDGLQDENALLDFNREKDGPLNMSIPAIAQTNFTYDVFSVFGHGAGGSFRPHRQTLDYVFDPTVRNGTRTADASVEVGAGSVAKVGVDLSVVVANSYNEKWGPGEFNQAQLLMDLDARLQKDEKIYFKEASDKSIIEDETFFNKIGGTTPANLKLKKYSRAEYGLEPILKTGHEIPLKPEARTERVKRNNVITYLTQAEMNKGYGVDANISGLQNNPHHIGEVSYLKNDGNRYIYGLPVYNKTQVEATFAVGTDVFGSSANNISDQNKMLVNYSAPENSTGNRKGIDHYFSETTTPAFAYSYLLTSIVSPEYVDVDNVKGPTDGDLGAYTRFKYLKKNDYKWRVPSFASGNPVATYDVGLKATDEDDRGHVLYGEKELYYLDSIVTKNYVAKFHVSPRADGLGAGGINSANSASGGLQYKLDSISLYSKNDIRASFAASTIPVPIKRVHFEYDYSLCKNLPNNSNASAANNGKLTLKKVFFTYSNSDAGAFSPYKFTYSSNNPNYNPRSNDRWGFYKSNDATSLSPTSTAPLSTSEFPYVEQNTGTANLNANAWLLTQIDLPSGGNIIVNYESDDYAFVQNRQAAQMYKICAADFPDVSGNFKPSNPDFSKIQFENSFFQTNQNPYLYFEIPFGETNVSQYFENLEQIYFKFLVKMDKNAIDANAKYEYIAGYSTVDKASISSVTIASKSYARFRFKKVQLGKTKLIVSPLNPEVSPVHKAALRFGRNQLPKVMDSNLNTLAGSKPTFGKQIISSLINLVKTQEELLIGPNKALHLNQRCSKAVTNKSFVKLNNVNGHKLGGGARVKSIVIDNNWVTMTNDQEQSSTYGLQYSYNLENGVSSGVAAYEPMVGGEENALKYPDYMDDDYLQFGDEPQYLETPYGESFYPTANVGYSRVTMKNTVPVGSETRGSGSTVYEFYTAKDFPTFSTNTGNMDRMETDKVNVLRVLAKLSPVKIVRDAAAVSQGFCIETNDMHGKPKAVYKFANQQTSPYSYVKYTYQQDTVPAPILNPRLNNFNLRNTTALKLPIASPTFKLNNDIKVVRPNGKIETKKVGIYADFVADFRHSFSETYTPTIQINTDVLFIVIGVIPIPSSWASFTTSSKDFKTAGVTKVIQRFGVLKEVEAKDNESVIITKNIAYDSETGNPIITEIQNNYNDPIFTMNFPAHWHYKQMGGAYKNVGFTKSNVSMKDGVISDKAIVNRLMEGDELIYTEDVTLNNEKVWVESADENEAFVTNIYGDGIDGTGTLKVIRSGYRNMLGMYMASITSLTNPLNGIAANTYENVLQANAVEYSNQAKVYCKYNALPSVSSNPYVTGQRGMWYVKRDQNFITDRKQTNIGNNVNLRRDGVFTNFKPYYQLSDTVWVKAPINWVSASQVAIQSPFGQSLESKDALDRYDAATFGYTQSLPTAVAKNSRYHEAGFEGFEKGVKTHITDQRFQFSKVDAANNTIANDATNESHTGYTSLRVIKGAQSTLKTPLKSNCPEVSECNITYKVVATTVATVPIKTLTVTGGNAPYVITTATISGNPIVTKLPATGAVEIRKGTYPYSVKVSIKDKSACEQIVIINN
jgi:hypothetical protein